VCGFEQEASYAHRTTLGQGGLHASELAEVTVGISDFGINGSDDAAETDEIGLVELELGGEVEKDLADVDDQVEGLGLVLAAVAPGTSSGRFAMPSSQSSCRATSGGTPKIHAPSGFRRCKFSKTCWKTWGVVDT